jgi:hypothetical protein
MKRAIVVVPVFRPTFTDDERLSLRFLRENLPNQERVIIAPRGLALDGVDDFRIIYFPARFFRSVYDYNRLMLSRRFYRTVADYEFILIYQLDALVFRDDLQRWCEAPYDYVGAPVFDRNGAGPWLGLNGGFSLRRVRACLRALEGIPVRSIRDTARSMPFMERNILLRFSKYFILHLHHLRVINAVPLLVLHSGYHEDLFWSRFARLFNGTFRAAPLQEALEFAFEMNPARFFEENGRRLPFGCHAWRRWEPEFWSQLLELPCDG